jgi:hypothetical protein
MAEFEGASQNWQHKNNIVYMTNLLAMVASTWGEHTGESSAGDETALVLLGRKHFQPLNIALDFGRSDKHIRPIGKRENRMY